MGRRVSRAAPVGAGRAGRYYEGEIREEEEIEREKLERKKRMVRRG
jgi:hypothetical protein